jgi:glycosyltransferase involved in cell wall biosynthesis
MIRLSIIAPVLNEEQFIGYSVMSFKHAHELIYLVDQESTDGTIPLLNYIKEKYLGDKLKILIDDRPGSHDMTVPEFNAGCYNICLEKATGNAIVCAHPDMICTNPESVLSIPEGPLSWWMGCRSFAGDIWTEIYEGRNKRWKSMFANKFGIHYFGGYGDTTEDFYFRDITGNAHKHHGDNFDLYPFEVGYSGVNVNHYCEMKQYSYRLSKMVKCLMTQNKKLPKEVAEEMAANHPRVTLQSGPSPFGYFEVGPTKEPVPDVFEKHYREFNQFIKNPLYVGKRELVNA